MKYHTKFFALAIILLPLQLFAGTIINSVSDDGAKGEVLIEGNMARMNFEQEGTYMLLDLKEGKTYMIDKQEGIVMDLDSEKTRRSEHSEIAIQANKLPQIEIIKIGDGPVISGYPTTAYKIMIGEQHCFDEYLSIKLSKHSDIKRFITAISDKSDASENVAVGMAMGTHNPCDAANDMVDDYYAKLGVPLRTIDSKGSVTHEITEIDLNASFPDGTFDFPVDYPVLTREQMMQRAMKEMSSSTHHDSMPEMSTEELEKIQGMMQQMPAAPGLDPP